MNTRKQTEQIQPENKSLPAANRTYRDTLFRMLFREKHNLLQLYNALNGTNYTKSEDLQVVTLENAIYMNMKNDAAFVLADYLNLYEHQSTFNPNMPLRDLFYISREYETLINQNSLYLSTKVQIPNPRFVVFYNGVKEQPDCQILKLSDLYRWQEEKPELELTVRVLNINAGHNRKIVEQCHVLSEYMQYVDMVRHYSETMPISEAVDRTVTECIKRGILADFLTKHRQEAISMSIFEYDEKEVIRLIRQDEFRQGKEEGLKQGVQQGIQRGIQRGMQQGMQQGNQRGILSSICNLMDTLNFSTGQAMEALRIPAEEQPYYIAQIQKNGE